MVHYEVHEYYNFFPSSKFISSIWKTRSVWTMTVADLRVISYRRSGLLWSRARSLLMRFTAGISCTFLSPSWKRWRVASSSTCLHRKLTSEKKITCIIIDDFNYLFLKIIFNIILKITYYKIFCTIFLRIIIIHNLATACYHIVLNLLSSNGNYTI